MKRIFLGSSCLVALALSAQVAGAADVAQAPVYTKAPPVVAQTWTGVYVGVGAGFVSGTYDLGAAVGDFYGYGDTLATAQLDGLGADGALFGLTIGADYQFAPQWVIGAFFDYDWHTEKVKASAAIGGFNFGEFGFDGASGSAQAEANAQWSVGARLGFLSAPSTLWYVSGGYTSLDIDDLTATAYWGDGGYGSVTIGIPEFDGWFVGVGVESMLTRNISLKAEYRYSGFDAKALTLPTIEYVNLNDYAVVDLEPTVQTFKVSVSYKFNSF